MLRNVWSFIYSARRNNNTSDAKTKTNIENQGLRSGEVANQEKGTVEVDGDHEEEVPPDNLLHTFLLNKMMWVSRLH